MQANGHALSFEHNPRIWASEQTHMYVIMAGTWQDVNNVFSAISVGGTQSPGLNLFRLAMNPGRVDQYRVIAFDQDRKELERLCAALHTRILEELEDLEIQSIQSIQNT